MNISESSVWRNEAPDSVESVLDNASATCLRFNHGRGLFAGHYMAAGRSDGIVAIWAVETRGLLRFLEGHVKVVTSVSWSPFSRYLASSSLDWNVIIWDLARRNGNERKHTLRFDAPVASVQFSPTSSKQLVVVLQTQQSFLINLSRRRLRKQQNRVNGAQSTADVQDTTLSLVEHRQELHPDAPNGSGEAAAPTAPGFISATFTSDGQMVTAGTTKGDVMTFDTQTLECIHHLSTGSSGVRELAFDRSGRTLVANLNDRSIRLFSFTSGKDADTKSTTVMITPQHRFQDLVNRTPWSGIGFSGDSEYVFGGAIHKAAHNIYIWDRGAGVLDKILQGPRDSLITCDWHPSRPMIASVSHTGAINVWFTPPTEIWSAYAPGFEELEENVIYQEREDEFDLEDEEEATRRKQDEEEALVEIVSAGPQQSVRATRSFSEAREAAVHQASSSSNVADRLLPTETSHVAAPDASSAQASISLQSADAADATGVAPLSISNEMHLDTSDGVQFDGLDDDEGCEGDEESESFAIPVRLSLDLPDLEGDG